VSYINGIDVLQGTWLDSLRIRKYSPTSVQNYRGALKKFAFFLAAQNRTRPQDITFEDIEAYQGSLIDEGISECTQENYMRAIRLFFTWAAEHQHIFINPAERLIIRQPSRVLQPVPTETEMKRLLAQPNASKSNGLRDRAILEILYSTGMRLGELTGLGLFDPDLDRGTVRVTGKGRKQRTVPLGRMAVHWLKLYLREARPKLQGKQLDETALWLNRYGSRLSGLRVQQVVRGHAAYAGIRTPITPHAIRRACATHLLANGAHPVQVQMLLGHSCLRHLGQYLRVTVTDLKKAHRKTTPGK